MWRRSGFRGWRRRSQGSSGRGWRGGDGLVYAARMEPKFTGSTPVLPAADTEESLRWWTQICGYTEAFRDATPANYAGISRGESHLHIAGMSDKALARTVGDQTMVRITVEGIDAYYAEYPGSAGARCIPTASWR